MTALKVVGGILLALLLAGSIRLGGILEYDEEGLRIFLRVGFLRFRMYPAEEKKEKLKKKKEKKKPAEEPAREKKGGALGPVLEYAPLICEAADTLFRRIRIDRLSFEIQWGDPDPAKAAMGYGYANAALGTLWPLIDRAFEVKRFEPEVGVDFDAKSSSAKVDAAFSFRLGQLVSFAVIYGVKFLKLYRKNRVPKSSQKEAVKNG